ncbi:hypothetical protein FACS1894216_17300 [Synergistales bacterium]|nr:hypothetical protein FACS1894216_17300 [Synergistales bacterium]
MATVERVSFEGSAMAGTVSVVIAAKLNETGTVMTFTRSYLMDGVPFENYGSPLTSEHRNLMGSDWLMKIRFRKAGTTVAYRELVSESPIIVAPTYEQATFRLESALEEGLYEMASYEIGDDNDGVDLVLKTPGDWDDWYDNFAEKSGLTENEMKTIEDRSELFENGNSQMSNTVLIEKEQPTPPTPSTPHSGGGGCNAGSGMFGLLLLAGFVTCKFRLTRSSSPK